VASINCSLTHSIEVRISKKYNLFSLRHSQGDWVPTIPLSKPYAQITGIEHSGVRVLRLAPLSTVSEPTEFSIGVTSAVNPA
jgi:hypothetical protein